MSNMEIFESIKAKLRKISALAEGGYEGEARNARILLERLCRKHGVSIDELLDVDKKNWYIFNVGQNSIFKNLFTQCYCCVMGTSSLSYKQVSSSKMGVQLTAYEYAELSTMFDWHKNNLKKDIDNVMETLLISYCSKHDIMSHTKSNNDAPMTHEEFNRVKAAIAMRDYLNDNYYRKQLKANEKV